MLCGKEKLDPEAHPDQEFYLCWDCSRFWLGDYLRRVRVRIAHWLHGGSHTGGA
jgi:hypothetical protein